jgi:hypothetical protein
MTIYGSDVSHYDAADTRAMFADGIEFQTHKAGGDSNDAELATWWNIVKGYRDRVMLGAYWVLYPGSPASRADSFLARLDSQCPGWRDGPFILQADCEKWKGDPATVPPVSDINAFCDRLVARMPKLRPIGYLPDWVYGDISGFRYPLWSSKYVTGTGGYRALYPGDSARQWAAYGGKSPSILQYTSSATIGGQKTCDANAFRGTPAQLTDLLAPGWTTTKEDDVALDSSDKAWFTTEMKRLLEQDGAVARGLRQQPNNLSDTERAKLTDVIETRLTPIIQGVDTDEASVIQGVLAGITPERLGAAIVAAGLTPEALVAAIPDDLAEQVLALLGEKLRPAQ